MPDVPPVPVRPQPPVRTGNGGDDHAAQEQAGLGQGGADLRPPAQLAGGLIGGLVNEWTG